MVRGPVTCPECDFRLDACRHCRYFEPSGARPGGALVGMGLSWTHGCCTYYKSMQPVESIATAEMARRMQERGYTHLRAPTPVVDSYIPLEYCSAFALEVKHLSESGMQKPGRRQRLALRVVADSAASSSVAAPRPKAAPASEQTISDQPLSDEEQWLI